MMLELSKEDDTREFGRRLGGALRAGDLVVLDGPLGAGKTVLAQGIARGLGIGPREVQSPTFTLIREHQGPGGRLVHVDLYRLDPSDVPALGLEELLAGRGVKVVEWAERLPFEVPGARWLRLRRLDEGGREIIESRQEGL